jgi:NAD-dependent deacetylase
MESRIKAFQKLIAESDNIVFFGGAGVSTGSGIPDFRGKRGLYSQKYGVFSPEYILSRNCFIENRQLFFQFYRAKMDLRGCLPNIVHKTLAEMELNGKLSAIITQNIDGLHQEAGSQNVIELHGSIYRNYCMRCGSEFNAEWFFHETTGIPHCPYCDGVIKPDVVLYGEILPEDALNDASNAIAEADLIIVAGTSLTVYPAANLIPTWSSSAKIVMINKDETFMDDRCEIVFHEDMCEVFKHLTFA